jgi:hypothetical protein
MIRAVERRTYWIRRKSEFDIRFPNCVSETGANGGFRRVAEKLLSLIDFGQLALVLSSVCKTTPAMDPLLYLLDSPEFHDLSRALPTNPAYEKVATFLSSKGFEQTVVKDLLRMVMACAASRKGLVS